MTTLTPTRVLDFKGLSCPLPIVKTAVALRLLAPGDVVEVHASDLGALRDFPAWCRTTGNELIATIQAPGDITFVIRKAVRP